MKQLKKYKLEESIKREGMKVLDLNKEDVRLLKSCKYAVSKEEYRPILKYIYIDKNNFVALDGYRLALRKHNLNINTKILVHPEILNLGNIKTIEIYEDIEKYYYIINNTYCYSINIFKDTYVNYNSLIPQLKDKDYIILSKKVLKELLKNKREVNGLKIDINNNNLIVKDYMENFIGQIAIINKNNINLYFGININYLKQALNNRKEKELKIYLNAPIKPVIIGNSNYIDLILPIRIYN